MLDYYFRCLEIDNMPKFLIKYLKVPSLIRLKHIGYFCGMDYASKDIYDFKELVSRYDHSLSTALLTWKLTKDKKMTLAALFHDIGTPCFSHVIDYMNKDYANQESTEEYTALIMKNDNELLNLFEEDNIDIDDIINFKKYSIVDNDRPKLCADRLDGVILTGAFWTKDINCNDIKEIIDSIVVFINEDYEEEIGFNNKNTAFKVLEYSQNIDIYCHSIEDNYMMELLASITRLGIDKGYYSYNDLYFKTELEVYNILKKCGDYAIIDLINEFENVKKNEIKKIEMPYIKKRKLYPLYRGDKTC